MAWHDLLYRFRWWLAGLFDRESVVADTLPEYPETIWIPLCRLCQEPASGDSPTSPALAELHADVVERGGPLCVSCLSFVLRYSDDPDFRASVGEWFVPERPDWTHLLPLH